MLAEEVCQGVEVLLGADWLRCRSRGRGICLSFLLASRTAETCVDPKNTMMTESLSHVAPGGFARRCDNLIYWYILQIVKHVSQGLMPFRVYWLIHAQLC